MNLYAAAFASLSLAIPFGLASAAVRDEPAPPAGGSRLQELPVQPTRIDRLRVTSLGRILEDTLQGIGGPAEPGGMHIEGVPAGCDMIATRTASNFGPGNYVAQGGFGEGETAAVSYQLPISAFPIRVSLLEAIFATSNAGLQTTTQYTVRVWDGTPDTGTEVFSFSSDDVIIPHLRIGPGTAATNIQFSVDSQDPDQIIVEGNAGTGVFSIGVRIDHHNQQTQSPCNVAPPTCCNAFPTTDNTQSICGNYSQLNFPTANWIFALNCGPNGCAPVPANQNPQPTGTWVRFSNLQADVTILPGLCVTGCRPRGDWVMRATWNSVACTPGVGACCLPTGSCDVRLVDDCIAVGGIYRGDASTCATANCPQPTGACCFGNSCITLTSADCATAQGSYLGNGTACAGATCPTGACCLATGACVITTDQGCTGQGGTFRGVGVSCANANCPPPTGACCLANGNCLVLTSTNCGLIPGSSFAGGGTACTACTPPCQADYNGDTDVNGDDLADYIADFFDSVGIQPGFGVPIAIPGGFGGNATGPFTGFGRVCPTAPDVPQPNPWGAGINAWRLNGFKCSVGANNDPCGNPNGDDLSDYITYFFTGC